MRYLGIDWGMKRIGFALSEGQLASPFKVVEVQSLNQAVAQVEQTVQRESVDQIILGQPEGEMGRAVQTAYKALIARGLKVSLVDETLTTQRSQELMVEMGTSQKRRQDDNAVAAALILQSYLDETR